MASVLEEQDHLYTLIERDSSAATPRVIGSIADYALVPNDAVAFAEQLAGRDVAIFSLTITEGGYSLAKPNATIEAIATGLDARREAGGYPARSSTSDRSPASPGTSGPATPRQSGRSKGCRGRPPTSTQTGGSAAT
jgi:hypothetical protein